MSPRHRLAHEDAPWIKALILTLSALFLALVLVCPWWRCSSRPCARAWGPPWKRSGTPTPSRRSGSP